MTSEKNFPLVEFAFSKVSGKRRATLSKADSVLTFDKFGTFNMFRTWHRPSFKLSLTFKYVNLDQVLCRELGNSDTPNRPSEP